MQITTMLWFLIHVQHDWFHAWSEGRMITLQSHLILLTPTVFLILSVHVFFSRFSPTFCVFVDHVHVRLVTLSSHWCLYIRSRKHKRHGDIHTWLKINTGTAKNKNKIHKNVWFWLVLFVNISMLTRLSVADPGGGSGGWNPPFFGDQCIWMGAYSWTPPF